MAICVPCPSSKIPIRASRCFAAIIADSMRLFFTLRFTSLSMRATLSALACSLLLLLKSLRNSFRAAVMSESTVLMLTL